MQFKEFEATFIIRALTRGLPPRSRTLGILNSRQTLRTVAAKGRHLAIDPITIDPRSQLYQLVLHVDDLIEASPEHPICDSPKSQIEIASFRPLKPWNLANSKLRSEVDSSSMAWLIFTDQLTNTYV